MRIVRSPFPGYLAEVHCNMHAERLATKHRIFRRFARVIQVTLTVLKGGRSQIRDDGRGVTRLA